MKVKGGVFMRWKAILLTALLLLGPGYLMAAETPKTAYPSSDDCAAAEKAPCQRQSDGTWVVAENDQGHMFELPPQTGDAYFGMRTQRAFQVSESGTADNPVVIVDMDKVAFPDALPYLDHEINRVRVPIRFVAEAMGAQVAWNDTSQTVTINREGLAVELVIGASTALVNGESLPLDAPAKLVQDRTMVPLRFISEAFGAKVDWVGMETPAPGLTYWGEYQVWVWIPWGYWGTATIDDRVHVHESWWYRDEGEH